MQNRESSKVFRPFQLFTRTELFLNEILDLTHDCLLLIDVKTKLIVYANKACESLYGYTQEELLGIPMSLINASPEHVILREMQKVIKMHPSSHRLETVHAHKNGHHVPVEVISKMIVLNDRNYFLSHITNITNQKKLQTKLDSLIRELSKQAYRDHLTGAYNRAYLFNVYLPRIVGRVTGVLMIDIDYFKRINDVYGHDAGDYILIEVVKIIRTCLRGEDKLIRYGGDEFVVILPNIHPQDISTITQRIETSFATSDIIFNTQKIACSVSIGTSVGHLVDCEQLEHLIKEADNNLLNQKSLRKV